MRKNLVLLLMTFLILGVSFQDTLTYVTFKINEEYIATNLCINKEVDKSCHGHCQLEKKFEESNDESKKNYLSLEERLFQNYCNSLQNAILGIEPSVTQNNYFYADRRLKTLPNSIFHPPRV